MLVAGWTCKDHQLFGDLLFCGKKTSLRQGREREDNVSWVSGILVMDSALLAAGMLDGLIAGKICDNHLRSYLRRPVRFRAIRLRIHAMILLVKMLSVVQ